MLIIADENIPAVHEAFSSFGEVRILHGRHMTFADVRNADVLLVRSITRVNDALLSGSRVKFVGSATIGTDHVDLDWLSSQGIKFANAPASNAVSAAEYTMSALFSVCQKKSVDLHGMTVGIIGCGNVGSRVMARMQAIGLRCLVCDPPRADREGQSGFVSMDEVASADIVTVHVPLVRKGKHATPHLINQSFIESMPSDCIFINTSRGDVVDEAALKHKLKSHKTFKVILDVWNNEPVIDVDLVTMVDIATPHIAGYSIDGKLRAIQMLHNSLCEFMGKKPAWDASNYLPEPEYPVINVSSDIDMLSLVIRSMRHVYNVLEDDTALRETLTLSDDERGYAFDLLRKEYAPRRECEAYQIDVNEIAREYTKALTSFNFQLVE